MRSLDVGGQDVTATAAPSHGALAALFDPVSLTTFVEQYFEKAPLHVKRNDPAYFAHVYDVSEVENAIAVSGSAHRNFSLIKAGATPVSVDDMMIERRHIRAKYTSRPPENVLDARAFVTHFDKGYTLLIKDAPLFSPRLQGFVNRLQSGFGFYVQSNVYFTPPNAQGFDVHHDTHDTLIMQIEGTKTWDVYHPIVELPLETQPLSGEEMKGRLKTYARVAVSPGDTLYVPRGYPHAARTGAGRSLHVTLALCPIRVIDLIETMLQLSAIENVEVRRSLPFRWFEDPAFAGKFASLINDKLSGMFPQINVLPAAELTLRDLFASTRVDGSAAFERLQRLSQMTPSSSISLREQAPHAFRTDGTGVHVLLAGKLISFPPPAKAFFARLEQGPATVAELEAILPGGAGRALVKQLLLEDLIEFV